MTINPLSRFLADQTTWLRGRLYYRFFTNPLLKKVIRDLFHRFFYGSTDTSQAWRQVYFLGVPLMKCPSDLWVIQEIIYEHKPTVIIECGTWRGGSALFLASVCDLNHHGRVITIDIVEISDRPNHPRITYLCGSSTENSTLVKVKSLISKNDKVMVILDSNHWMEHVLKELNHYSELVTMDQYLIVEDTNINGHPVYSDFGPGPMEAVEAFLKTNRDFVVDRSKEKLLLTFNPNGYLKRIM